MIDTQNKIWSKIIQREKQNYQENKKMLKNDRIALIVNQGNLNEFFRKKVRGNKDVALPVRLFSKSLDSSHHSRHMSSERLKNQLKVHRDQEGHTGH